MNIKVRRTDPKNVKYNLQGSGLIPRSSPICKLEKCKPKANPTPVQPKPRGRTPRELKPLTATKQGPDTNKWELNGQVYPTFNSLWVNIPGQQYTQLKVKKTGNGRDCR